MTKQELFHIGITEPDRGIYDAAKRRFDRFAKPIDGLGDAENLICRIAAIQGKELPDISKKVLVILCADNGVVREGVSQTDQSVTAAVASLMAEGRSSVGAMTRAYPLDILPVDIGIDSDVPVPGILNCRIARGTGNIVREPAMTEGECLQAIETGIGLARECADKGYGLIATGEMGIGNTTTSTAVFCALTGEEPEQVTGRGAGLTDEGLARKIDTIRRALTFHGWYGKEAEDPEEAPEVLRRLGGLDLAGLAGLYIGGARYRIPVVIAGFISAVAALLAERILPGTAAFMIASHTGRERGTARALEQLDLKPLIDADLALGEGTGAVLLLPMLDMAMSLYCHGVSFEETQITAYERYSHDQSDHR